MAIVEIKTTVSVRYYEKKSKAAIVRAINTLSDQLGVPRPASEEFLNKTAHELARMAIRLHDQFPE